MNINMLERREWVFKNFLNKSYLFADGGGGRLCSCCRGGGGDQSEYLHLSVFLSIACPIFCLLSGLALQAGEFYENP